MQLSCGLLCTVLYLCNPILENLMQTLLHITPSTSKNAFKICTLKSDVIPSCSKGKCCIQHSHSVLCSVLWLRDPILGNLMQSLVHLTLSIPKSAFKICVLKSDMIFSCYRG